MTTRTSSRVGLNDGIAATLAEFATDLSLDRVPKHVRERAKYLILDAVGLAYATKSYPFTKVTLDGLMCLGSGP